MTTANETTEAAEARALALRMFFLYGVNAVSVVHGRLAAARQDGDAAKAARWEAVLAAIDAPADAAPAERPVDAMLACWRRLSARRPLELRA